LEQERLEEVQNFKLHTLDKMIETKDKAAARSNPNDPPSNEWLGIHHSEE
jgi:hypothetical protein